MQVHEYEEWQYKMHHINIQDKHKIMQDIDTNSYLTNLTPLTIESKLLTSTQSSKQVIHRNHRVKAATAAANFTHNRSWTNPKDMQGDNLESL